MMTTRRMPFHLPSTFLVLRPDQSATPVDVTPSLYEHLDRDFAGFRGHWLVSCFSFDCDWPTWEIHPAGDEFVYLLSGEATMIVRRDGAEDRVHLREPGSYVIVPKNCRHTAKTTVPTVMLFVTPGEGTENKPV